MQISFTKMHGTGNDFVVIDGMNGGITDLSPSTVIDLCSRHFGIGADGVIIVRPPSEKGAASGADAYMHYFNSDGTLAEMCGNGVRCTAKFIVDAGYISAERDSCVIETLDGLKPISFTRGEGGTLLSARVDMGTPVLDPQKVPTTLLANATAETNTHLAETGNAEAVISRPLETEEGTYEITAVSMGNPHAVIFIDDDPATFPVEAVGKVIETHEAFPQKTNVEFVHVEEDAHVMRVWERGCGETLACGTGTCAVAVAAFLDGRAGRDATVKVRGGSLELSFDADTGHVFMEGPATHVFEGTVTV